MSLGLTLRRDRGAPVQADTIDLAEHGTRVTSQRPLGIDELFSFDLMLGASGPHLTGQARVVREHSTHVYGLRFEHLSHEAERELASFVHSHL